MPKLSLRPEWRIFVSQCRIPARCFPSHMADHCVFHYVCEPDRYGSIIRSGCMAAIRFSDYFVPLGLSFRLMYRTHTFFLWRMHGTERRTDTRSHVSAIIVEYDSRDNCSHTTSAAFLSASLYLVKEALIEIGCVVTSLVVGWLSRACTVAKRCILGL